MVLSGPGHDHLHRLVSRHRFPPPWPGGRGEAFGANEAGSLLYRRHKHPLHIRWARCHSVSRHNTLVPSKYRA
ncbi:hypothetical protein BHM03_00010432 [Ensete ventricosum]|uniref:Uncharacterized protein n=1 Tax=Ensete ventricosum TaxID=4639 RepID=A0A445MCX3_ENSVE|nr:hypothetical protein BHM03_00010432 [Ensete ventricosum]